MMNLILTPAYGRDYKSKAAVIKDWNEGKDFVAHSLFKTTYVNVNDCPKEIDVLEFRYNKNQKVFFLTNL